MPSINHHETRHVRTYAVDLCIGDIVVDDQRRYVGTVDDVPTMRHGVVTVLLHMGEPEPVERHWRDSRVVRIEIPRRVR